MTVNDLKTLYDYSYWANNKLFQVIAALSDDEFTRTVAGSYGSIRTTLVHILRAEWQWLSRCGGHPYPGQLDTEKYSSPDQLRGTWNEVETYVRDFLNSLQDEDLVQLVEYSGAGGAKRKMPLGELMQHAANHGAHHRGQVTLLLRMLGYTPGNIDLLFYFGEQNGVKAW